MAACLVTGASGFLGRHLWARLSIEQPGDRDLVAIGRQCPLDWPAGSFRSVDLADRDAMMRLIADLTPSTVFHLAGKTPPGVPEDLYRANTLATVHLLDALRAAGEPCRVVLVGSAAELGPLPVEFLPVGEDHPCRPADPYGLSKWLATCAGLAAGPPLEVVIARVFNPIGPGLPTSQALGRFADELARGTGPTSLTAGLFPCHFGRVNGDGLRSAAEVPVPLVPTTLPRDGGQAPGEYTRSLSPIPRPSEKETALTLTVGDLDVARDFVDVRDVAQALIALASRGLPGRVYHVGTGRSQRVSDGLDRLIALSGRDVRVEVDPARLRSRGPLDSRADVQRIHSETGWSARISWEQSLRDLWEDAKGRSQAGLTGPSPAV